jgi:hypothetical protein
MGHPIDVSPDTIAAFIGRALRGPLNTPVLINNFAGFRRRFGGHWYHSSLGPAVKQFFEHGGRELYIVRVANNVRGAMICLPAKGGVVVLRALEPGSTENIRAAIDYDGIDDEDEKHFNLTIQRVAPDSGLVADQEIYRRLHCVEGESSCMGDVLLSSSLVRAGMPLPGGRPMATTGSGFQFGSTYVGHAQHGSDGSALSDYDLIGSASKGTGLFSLNQIEHFDLLYMPPPGRHMDLGPAAMLAAELYCRKRGAMLIMDPPESWTSAKDAVASIRGSGYSSPNILAYYPRMRSRQDEESAPHAAGGAIAGLLCKLDRTEGGQGRTERDRGQYGGVCNTVRLCHPGTRHPDGKEVYEPDRQKTLSDDYQRNRTINTMGCVRVGCDTGYGENSSTGACLHVLPVGRWCLP